jgi:integrase
LVASGQASCPVAFSYEETHPSQRIHVRLWDRRSFVLGHADQYSSGTRWEARCQIRAFCPERMTYFLEVVGTELLDDGSSGPVPERFLWFGDVLHYDVLSEGPCLGTPEEIERKQAYLHSWGYESELRCKPFSSGIAGLLAWPYEHANFLRKAQARAQGPLVLVEPLFAAATFGLAALDFFTTTGARMNELLQVRLTPDCLYTMVVEGTPRLLVRLIPKGMTRAAEYVVGPETRRHFERVALILQEHYGLQAGETLPAVAFCQHHGRVALFPDHQPYLFQYGGQHLSPTAITACLRFLCHGLVFQAVEGKTVVLKAHLLRHVFATHIHHVEQVPLDIVAVLLHQKNTRVTGYYAAPSWHQVMASADAVLDRFATHLGSLDDAFMRAPAELQRQYEEAKERVGTLAKVPGGACTCHGQCPVSF